MTLDLTSLQQGVRAMRAGADKARDDLWLASLDEVTRKLVQAGVIQNFEFTYELCWKFMRRWLMDNVGSAYVEGIPRRQLFRLAAEHRLIEDAETWFDHHKARNLASHTYSQPVAQEVFEAALRFVADAETFLAAIEARNG